MDLLRNDPIGFMEEVREQASVLTSLSERSPGKIEALKRGHSVGRHVSMPLLKG